MNRPNEFKAHNIQKDIEWAIGLNRNILKIVGLWPQDSKNLYEALLLKLKLLITIIMLVFVITIPLLLLLIRTRGDKIQIIENMQYLLPSILTMVKIFIVMCKKKALSSLIDMIVEDWMKVKSEKIYHATCENVWYDLEPKEAKNLILIMLRAKKPLQITVEKFFPMTMSTFRNLLNTSGGYISVLLANKD